MIFGYGTVPIVIIAGVVIAADLVIGMLMLSNKKTVSRLNNLSTHAHQEMKEKQIGKYEINNETIQTKK